MLGTGASLVGPRITDHELIGVVDLLDGETSTVEPLFFCRNPRCGLPSVRFDDL